MECIIITSAESRKSFDIYNILKRKGYKIYLTSKCSKLKKKILQIAYKDGYLLKNNNLEINIKFLLSRAYNNICLFPTEEVDILEIYNFKNKYKSCKFIIPSEKFFNTTRNKKDFSDFCKENKLPIPLEFPVSELKNNLLKNNTIIAKPKIGAGGRENIIIKNKDDLKKIKIKNFFFQEVINKNNKANIIAGCYLFENGKLINFYSHKRIRTFPEEGGVTILSKVYVNDQIKKLGEKILKILKWNGFAMIEFLWCPVDNKFKIIELNPRTWGSIMLSEKCNSEMLNNYVRLCLGKKIYTNKITTDVSIRWIFPYEIINLLKLKISPIEFFSFSKKECLINISYSSFFRTFLFLIYQLLFNAKFRRKAN